MQRSPSFSGLKKATLLPAPDGSNELRRSNSDSNMMRASTKKMSVWICSICSYENVDPTKNTCGLCETQRTESSSSPSTQNSRPPQEITKFSTPTKTASTPLSKAGLTPPEDQGLDLPNLDSSGDAKGVSNASATQDFKKSALFSSGPGSSESKPDHIVLPPQLSKLKGTAESLSQKLLSLSNTLTSSENKKFSNPNQHPDREKLSASTATIPTTNIKAKTGDMSSSDETPAQMTSIVHESISSVATIPTSTSEVKKTQNWKSEVTIPAANKPLNNHVVDHSLEHHLQSTPEEGVTLSEMFRNHNVPRSQDPLSPSQEMNIGLDKPPENPNQNVPIVIDPPVSESSSAEPLQPWETPPSVVLRGGTDIENPDAVHDDSMKLYADQQNNKPASSKRKIFRLVLIGLVVLVVVLTVALSGDSNDGDGRGGGTLVTSVPTPPGSTMPLVPTTQPTSQPTRPLAIDFESLARFDGTTEGSSFGSSVALSSDGTLLAASGIEDAVRFFELKDDTWQPHSTFLMGSASVFSLASSNDIPVLAVASATSFGVVEFIGGAWTSRGQTSLNWVSTKSTVESVEVYAISISPDGLTLAAGSMSMNKNGDSAIVVRLFAFNQASRLWENRGDAIVRQIIEGDGVTGLTLGLDLSNDGSVVSLNTDTPPFQFTPSQTNIEIFEWGNNAWTEKGGLSFSYNYAVSTLSGDGQSLAVTTAGFTNVNPQEPTGSTFLYQWEDGEWVAPGEFSKPGGSSIALARGGTRAVTGRRDKKNPRVWIHDLQNGVWTQNILDSKGEADRFGYSIAMSSDGNTIAVGSPGFDSNGEGSGSVFIYTPAGVYV